MGQLEQNEIPQSTSIGYLEEQITLLRSMLSYGMGVDESEIKISFPTLKNFYLSNNIYKSSWAIYINENDMPKLLYTGNFLIQGGAYAKRANKSPFGLEPIASLTSIANTFSYEASYYKQNWTLDLDLLSDTPSKLKFSVKEYKDFLKLLNLIRAQWLLHLSEEGDFDFVIIEFSEPSDPVFFVDLENVDSMATKIRTYFKPISERSVKLFREFAMNTEFEGKLSNLQPGAWLRDDVIVELVSSYTAKIKGRRKELSEPLEQISNNPFKTEVFKSVY